MWKYILRRFVLMIPVILGVTIVVFSVMYVIPGDPAIAILGSEATAAELDALREQLNLNQPYLTRLGIYIYDAFIKLDLGSSYITGIPVVTELMQRLPNTLILDVVCILFSLVFGIPLGIFAATHQGKAGDYFSIMLAFIGVSVPSFWFALMLVLLFSNTLGWLPAYGFMGIQYWIMPVLSSALFGVAMLARQMRSSMLEVIHSDYIVMARSKGISKRDVIYKHALPNALIPVVTITGTSFGLLLGGNMITETIFSIPGIGNYMIKAINNRDFPAVQGSVLLLAIAFGVIMLLTDLAMAFIDPRIKTQFMGKKKMRKKTGEVM